MCVNRPQAWGLLVETFALTDPMCAAAYPYLVGVQVTTPTVATPTLTKLDPEDLHLVEDDEEEEGEERSWRR